MILETQLTKISYEEINDKFSYGNYLGVKVILMKENGYVNATKLCALANKQFKHWLENKSSKSLVEEVEKEISGVGNPTSELMSMIMITTGSKNETETRGTYVHPLLISHIASWCCPVFAIKVSKIVNHFAIKEMKEEYEKALGQKDDKIDSLQQTLDAIKSQNDYLIQTNNELLEDSKHSKRMLETAHDKLDTMQDTLLETQGDLVDTKYEVIESNYRLDTVQEKLGVAVVDRVPKLEALNKREIFIVIKMGHKDKTKHDYYVIRGQRGYATKKDQESSKILTSIAQETD